MHHIGQTSRTAGVRVMEHIRDAELIIEYRQNPIGNKPHMGSLETHIVDTG